MLEINMPLGLHDNCKSRLIEALARALERVQVRNGNLLEFVTAWSALKEAEAVLPNHKDLQERIVSYLDDTPFSSFVLHQLTEELGEEQFLQSAQPVNLNTLERYQDITAVATRLVHQFDDLPFDYSFTVALPAELSELLEANRPEFSLSPSVKIVRATAEFCQRYPQDESPAASTLLPLGLLAALGGQDGMAGRVAWAADGVYLQVTAGGYIGRYSTNTRLEVIRQLKAFFGLGLAMRLLTTTAFPGLTGRSYVAVHSGMGGDGCARLRRRFDLSERFARAVAPLRVMPQPTLSASARREWLDSLLSLMSRVFQKDKSAEQILLAAQWFFDSGQGDDELLRFVQSMVVLESLLGDKASSKEIGLSELLRSRCAYLIANSQDERATIISKFNDIYDVRSKILHQGKHRLSGREQKLLYDLRDLCHRVIQKEVQLLHGNETATNRIARLLVGAAKN